jgi:nicotinamidase-related amidase
LHGHFEAKIEFFDLNYPQRDVLVCYHQKTEPPQQQSDRRFAKALVPCRVDSRFAKTLEVSMPAKNQDLHGFVPDKANAALLLIDVINDLEFEGGDQLLEFALPVAERIAELKKRCKKAGVPAIYVNDNFGKWQSDFKKLLAHCLDDDVRGKPLAKLLGPDDDDYFVLKPKHSGFFSSTLDTLLEYLQARTLFLTGIAGNICVLFTANDAYMRDFELVIPADCVASNTEQDNNNALELMKKVLKANVSPSTELDLGQFLVKSPCDVKEPVLGTETPQFAKKR